MGDNLILFNSFCESFFLEWRFKEAKNVMQHEGLAHNDFFSLNFFVSNLIRVSASKAKVTCND